MFRQGEWDEEGEGKGGGGTCAKTLSGSGKLFARFSWFYLCTQDSASRKTMGFLAVDKQQGETLGWQ